MDYENLLRSMEASADEKKDELIKKAVQSARKAEEDARVKADEIIKKHMSAASRKLEIERNRQLYEARGTARKDIVGVKYDIFSKAFNTAEARLASIRDSDGYEGFLRKAIAEAVDALGEKEYMLHVDARDLELCRKILGSQGIEPAITADLTCAGGLSASTVDGKVVVHNTVESRLRSAKERMKLDTFFRLFGD
jgi:V/A-type H+/Na+-transporting ATPase subunit E